MRSLSMVLAAAAFAAPAALADSLTVPARGGRNLAFAGGWTAWAESAKSDGRWKLVVRAPNGKVADASIPSFGSAPDPAIGSTGYPVKTKRIVAVYARCSDTSGKSGCDLYQYDLAGRRETKLTRLSTRAGSERAPSVALGAYSFVRTGGASGTYTAIGRRVRRIDRRVASATAVSQSRVAYLVGGRLLMSQLDGKRRRTIENDSRIFSPVITRYRVGWLTRATAYGEVVAKMTGRISAGSPVTVHEGSGALPRSTNSAATGDRVIEYYLDAVGVHHASPPLFR